MIEVYKCLLIVASDLQIAISVSLVGDIRYFRQFSCGITTINNKQIITGESHDTINCIHYFIQEKIDTYRQLQENEFKHQMDPSKSQCESEYTQLFKRQLKKSSINQTACCNITNKNLRKSEQNARNYNKFFKFWRTLIQDR